MDERMTLDYRPDDEDDRLGRAIENYFTAAESGPLDPQQWLSGQPAELRALLGEFVDGQLLLAQLRPNQPGIVPPTLPDFQRYTEIELIGKGGMGAVYRAMDGWLGRRVAIKVIHNHIATHVEHGERFRREARLMARLQHRNILPIYDFGTMPGIPPRSYFTMRLIEGDSADPLRGRTLKAAIDAQRANPTPEGFQAFLLAFIGICDAIAHAHAFDIMHRDLKPSNILMESDRDVLVVDWGLGKLLAKNPNGRPSTQGGTPEYLAPEHAQGIEVGTPTDVFGLGGILTAILTHHPVFMADTLAGTVTMAARGDTAWAIARLRSSRRPAELIALAERCIDTDPAARPTATEVGAAVVHYLASLEERAGRAELEAVRAAERIAREQSRRRLQGSAALAALAALLALAAVWIFVRWVW